MADTSNQFNPSSLNPNQQDLLLAALSSNNSNNRESGNNTGARTSTDLSNQNFSFDSMDPQMFPTANSNFTLGNFESPLGTALDDSPYVDFLDGNDPNFEFDYGEEDGTMIGDLPGADELHDKRKMSSDDNSEDNENGSKRREGEDKTAKKPGRKPLTSEPTSKRKAQNRAAQRAFRERKEKHLKDLETKVGELEKTSESTTHENGLLRAQVERLQVELREYRKRLSLNSTSNLGRSPPTGNSLSFMSQNANGNNSNNFQFEFPRFGSVPSPLFPINSSAKAAVSPPATHGVKSNSVPGILARNDSTPRSISPRSQARLNGSISLSGSPAAVQSPAASINGGQTQSLTNDNMANMFSTGTFSNMNLSPSMDYNSFLPNTTAEPQSINGDSGSTSGQSRIFQFNSTSVSSDSPGSSSSISQYGGGPNSSCGTSPEPSHNSPSTGNKDATLDTINENSTMEGETTFCDKLNMACGNIKDPIPRANSNGASGASSSSNNHPTTTTTAMPSVTSSDPLQDFDWMSNQNGGQFDPVLFGDYREPQNAIVGDGDFTGGFFNDALPTMDFGVGSPFNWADLTAPTGLTPAVQKSNPMEQADALQAGLDDIQEEVVPGDDPTKLMSCHKIWDKLQERPDFKDGSLDIDGLCSELRTKARCSETGVVIDQKDVDTALLRLPASRHNSNSQMSG